MDWYGTFTPVHSLIDRAVTIVHITVVDHNNLRDLSSGWVFDNSSLRCLLLEIHYCIPYHIICFIHWSLIHMYKCEYICFCLYVSTGEIWGWWCFVISCVTYIPVMFLPLLLSSFDRIEEDDGKKESSEEGKGGK